LWADFNLPSLGGALPALTLPEGCVIKSVDPQSSRIWAETVISAFTAEGPVNRYDQSVLQDFIIAERAVPFVALCTEAAAAAAAMTVHSSLAIFFGAATLPQYRRRGLQTALLVKRLRVARDQHHCRWAAVYTEPQSPSSHNVRRMGFSLAYFQIMLAQP
jgi:GNAT superfamily N-acetyltransferase